MSLDTNCSNLSDSIWFWALSSSWAFVAACHPSVYLFIHLLGGHKSTWQEIQGPYQGCGHFRSIPPTFLGLACDRFFRPKFAFWFIVNGGWCGWYLHSLNIGFNFIMANGDPMVRPLVTYPGSHTIHLTMTIFLRPQQPFQDLLGKYEIRTQHFCARVIDPLIHHLCVPTNGISVCMVAGYCDLKQ